MKLNIF